MNVFVPVADIVTLEQDDCVERVKAEQAQEITYSLKYLSTAKNRFL